MHCHGLSPACNCFHNGARVIATRMGAELSLIDCFRIANRARPQSGLRKCLNASSFVAQRRLLRAVAMVHGLCSRIIGRALTLALRPAYCGWQS